MGSATPATDGTGTFPPVGPDPYGVSPTTSTEADQVGIPRAGVTRTQSHADVDVERARRRAGEYYLTGWSDRCARFAAAPADVATAASECAVPFVAAFSWGQFRLLAGDAGPGQGQFPRAGRSPRPT